MNQLFSLFHRILEGLFDAQVKNRATHGYTLGFLGGLCDCHWERYYTTYGNLATRPATIGQ